MREFERYLKVSGWESGFGSVQNLLTELGRKTKSESSRRHYLESLYVLCREQKKTPDELVKFGKAKAERAVQSLIDDMRKEDRSIRYINVTLAHLLLFFKENGFKNGKTLEVKRYFMPTRYSKRAEYIPTDLEVRRMAENAGSPKARACILALYTSGLRNSTLRAILYGDVKAELDEGTYPVHVRVSPEMKKIDPDACKGSIPYSAYFSKETAIAVKVYVEEFNRRNKPLKLEEPLFQGRVRGRPIKRRTLEVMVKDSARRAGIVKWQGVHPHVLRKAFERAVRNSGLDPKEQEYLQGHILPGSQDTYLDKATEEFRSKHAKVEFFPALAPASSVSELGKRLAQREDEINDLRAELARRPDVDLAALREDLLRTMRAELGGLKLELGDEGAFLVTKEGKKAFKVG